jgi:prepilin signal peptidase PulO-like enzyme (type II secretory pathway)
LTHLLDLLPGMIWAGFLGLAIGNCATNPIYRLPRGEKLFARDPYCGDCNAPLKPRDLFPVFSWLSTKGKCRYCGASVPGAYTVMEALTGLAFIFYYLTCGFSEPFILLVFGTTTLLMLIMMLVIDKFFSDRTLVACIIFGMLQRTLHDHTLYGFLGGAYIGLIAAVIAWKLSGKPMVRDMAAFPTYLKLLVMAGIWLHPVYLGIFLTSSLVIALLRKHLTWGIDVWLLILSTLLLYIENI